MSSHHHVVVISVVAVFASRYSRLSCLPWRTAARRLFTPSLA